jgi:hypothetical protein
MSIGDMKLGRRAVVQGLAAIGAALSVPAIAAENRVGQAPWLEVMPKGVRFLSRKDAMASLGRNTELSLHARCNADPNLLAERWWVAGSWDVHAHDATRWGPWGAGPHLGRLELARNGTYIWDHAPVWIKPRGRWGMTHEGGSRFPLFFEHSTRRDFVGYQFGREEHLAAEGPDMPVEFFWKAESPDGDCRDFLVARSFRSAGYSHWAPSDRKASWPV